jgi:hypothetical protein
MKGGIIYPILFFLTFLLNNASGQTESETIASDTVKLHLVETTDGNQYIGEIVFEDEEAVRLKTQGLGEIKLSRVYIRKIEPVDSEKLIGEEYWAENPQSTRYFWAPNGYGLKKGEGYYQNVWILFNQIAVGVTDHFSIGGGIVPAFLFAGAPTPVWITPKVSIPIVEDKFNLGAGVLGGVVIGQSNSSFGIFYGISTIGSRDKHLSIGLGYGFAGGRMANLPVINISGMTRIGKKGYFMSENYFIPSTPSLVLLSFGGRSILNNIGLDYGLFIPIYEDLNTFFAVPWLGLTIPFGKKRNKK